MVDEDGEWLSLEQLSVLQWRHDEALKAGLTKVEAELFAQSDRELGELRKLIAKGCPVEKIRAIVL